MAARYRNTDLEIRAGFDLAALALAFNRMRLSQMGEITEVDGIWRVCFEADLDSQHPRDSILALLAAIWALDDASRAVWDGCSCRCFDIGFECSVGDFYSTWEVGEDLIREIAAARASLAVTIYRRDPAPTLGK